MDKGIYETGHPDNILVSNSQKVAPSYLVAQILDGCTHCSGIGMRGERAIAE